MAGQSKSVLAQPRSGAASLDGTALLTRAVRTLGLVLLSGALAAWLRRRLAQRTALMDGRMAREAPAFHFEQLFDTLGSSTYTYLLGCKRTGEAVLLDPVLGNEERDLKVLQELGLRLKFVVNTHCHADHVTSGSSIRERQPSVRTVISRASGAKADVKLEDMDKVTFGDFHLEARATPGHTEGCMTFVLRGPGNPLMAFTGDALLIRGCGRTDFQGGNAAQLHDSVHGRIFSLPAETRLYPGHDYKGRFVTTVDQERRLNPRLTQSKEGFVRIMDNLGLPRPKLMDVALPANLNCGVQD